MTTLNMVATAAKTHAGTPKHAPDHVAMTNSAGFGVDEFVSNFETLIGAHGGIKGVRNAIMGAACRGLLTESGEGTGQAVLRQTAEAVRDWAKESAIREREAQRHLAKLRAQRVQVPSIQLPAAWTWGSLLAVCTRLVDCHNKTAPYVTAGVMLLRTSNIRDGRISLDGVKYVSEETYMHWSRRCPPEPGDLIITREAPMGEVGLVEPGMRVCMGQRQMLLRVAPEWMLPEYLLLALREPAFQSRLSRAAVGSTVKHLRVGDVESLVVPIPPTEEQKRIVARVDQLMALIDQLEVKQTRKREVGTRFTKAALGALTTTSGPEDFDVAWNRVLANWQTLLDRPEKVAEIRHAIAGLALAGRLVSSGPRECVDTLLASLSRAGRQVRFVANPPPSDVPASWRWLHFESVVAFGPKNGYSPKSVDFETKTRSLTLTATTSGKFDGRHFKFIDEEIPEDSDLWLREGDILIQRGNTIDYVGVAAIYRGPERAFIYPDLMMKIRVEPVVDLDFMHLALNCAATRAFIRSRASGTSGSMPKVNQGVVLDIPIPVPPTEEQRRIAARYAALMSLCDDLEHKLRRAEDGASKLVEAVVQAILENADAHRT